MKRTMLLGLMAVVLVAGMAAETPQQLYQQALVKERSEGKLDEAIQLYRRAADAAGKDRALAANALIQLAACYEKLGNTESRKIYERVVKDYADQKDAVTLARTRLSTAPAATSGAVSRQVWTGAGVDNMGSPSADGRLLSFTDWQTGDLAIRDLAAGTNRRLTAQSSPYSDGYASRSRISPDGKQVAFAWQKTNGMDLRLTAVSGGGVRVLNANPETEYLEPAGWSPDGKRLLAKIDTRSRTERIAWIPVAGGPEITLKTVPWGSLGYVALSPNGTYVAYDFQPAENSSNRNIMLLSADGSREIAVSENTSGAQVFGWGRDGKILLFRSNRSGTADLWAFRVNEGRAEETPVLVRRDVGARIRPMGVTDKGVLYYSSGNGASDVYTATWDWASGKEGEPSKIAGHRLLGVNASPDWSPDGKDLAYISRPVGQDSSVITILSTGTGEERQLPAKGVAPSNGPLWSPDGRSVMVIGLDQKKRRGVYALDAVSGESTTLVVDQTGQNIFNPEWLPDGKSIVYYRRDENNAGTTSHLVVRNLQTGAERELSSGSEKERFLFTSLSADGRFLAFFSGGRGGTGKLKIMPINGGDVRELDTADEPSNIHRVLGWTPDSSQVILAIYRRAGNRTTGRTVLAIPVSGGKPRLLPALDPEIRSLRFHPNGQQVAFHATHSNGEISVLENFLPATSAGK